LDSGNAGPRMLAFATRRRRDASSGSATSPSAGGSSTPGTRTARSMRAIGRAAIAAPGRCSIRTRISMRDARAERVGRAEAPHARAGRRRTRARALGPSTLGVDDPGWFLRALRAKEDRPEVLALEAEKHAHQSKADFYRKARVPNPTLSVFAENAFMPSFCRVILGAEADVTTSRSRPSPRRVRRRRGALRPPSTPG